MSFPGLKRCAHGEYIDRVCLRCEIERLTADLAALKETLTGVRSMHADALEDAERLRCENERLRAGNAVLLECGSVAEYAVSDRSDFEKDMM